MKDPLNPQTPTSSVAPAPGVARDPVRLLAGGGSPFERRLLESVAGDHMSAASEQRLAQLLERSHTAPTEAGAASPKVLPGAAATRVGRLATRAGWGALGLVAAFLVRREPAPASSTELAAPTVATTTAAPAMVATAPALTARVASPEPATRPVPRKLPGATASRAVSDAADVRPKRSVRATPEATPEPPAATANDSPHDLRAELRLLEGAKAALHEGRANAAADTLADHARRFPAGELAVEAELLRIDLALLRGERPRAWATARRLLALPSAAQYRERLEALLRHSETRGDDRVGAKHGGADMTKRR